VGKVSPDKVRELTTPIIVHEMNAACVIYSSCPQPGAPAKVDYMEMMQACMPLHKVYAHIYPQE